MDKSGADSGRTNPHWTTLLRWALLGSLAFVAGVSLLDFPSYVAPGNNLDASWQQALGYFLKQRLQAGPDYVFTYGPLGYFYTSVYDADLFWWKYAWELVVKSAMAASFLIWAHQLRCTGLGSAFCLLVLVFFPEVPHADLLHRTDGMYAAFLLALGLLPLSAERPSLLPTLAIAAVLAVLSFLKFNMAVLGALVLAVLSLNLLLRRETDAPRFKEEPGRLLPRWRIGLTALCPGFVFLVVRLGVGLALGQWPASLPQFLHGAVEVANGYVEGMALPDSPELRYLALAAFAVLAGAVVCCAHSLLRQRRQQLALQLLLGMVFVMWKQGFVRHGLGPAPFFNFMLLVPFAFPLVFRTVGVPGRIGPLRAGLLVLALLLALVGRFACEPELPKEEESSGLVPASLRFAGDRWERFASAWEAALDPGELRAGLEEKRREYDQFFELASIRERVQDASIDEITNEQAVLLRNGLNYRPRPVFQSYSAYTPYLLERNAEFYRSDRAPEYVLLNLWTIDDRLPILDDGPALLEIFQRYYPCGVQGPYLLLKCAHATNPPRPAGADRHVRLERTLRLGEEVTVEPNAPYQVLHLHLSYSLPGKVQKFLFRPPQVWLRVTLDTGETRPFRIIPGMAECRFLLNPFLTDTEGISALYRGEATTRVKSFAVLVPQGPECFADEVRVTLEGLSELPCRQPDSPR